MAEIEPPSFSLGLDLDFESSFNQNQLELNPNDNNKKMLEEELQCRVSNSDLDSLRNSPPACSPTDHLSTFQCQTLCSSSKFPSAECRDLTRPCESKLHVMKRKQHSSRPPSSVASNKGKAVLQELSPSPMRMFQLLDSESDSDDPSEGVLINRNTSLSKKYKQTGFKCGSSKGGEKTHLQASGSQMQAPWKDVYVDYTGPVPKPAFNEFFDNYSSRGEENRTTGVPHEFLSSRMGSSINKAENLGPTEALGSALLPYHHYLLHDDFRIQRLVCSRLPYFDHKLFCEEFCKEYIKGGQHNITAGGSDAMTSMQTKGSESAVLPCHRYFFHGDFRIQRLVCSQLPYFSPLSAFCDTQEQPRKPALINYMSQFCYRDDAKQKAGTKQNVKKRSKKAGKHVRRRRL